ncbi:lytic transglycosylase domain-containing protein [Aquariibacter albus]|uniref:Lytic transglycosylase domain-containing protein n=1 Tax=Aquariibacter albus TaxID=2759899 RepID=A0A839HI66_9BURK|nr:lytic transglycosylase domain-containing protein [Aquariibacter albus]MBB1161136.1 lytic transglycosylase domain-containing protein [Aquariibacter albus]
MVHRKPERLRPGPDPRGRAGLLHAGVLLAGLGAILPAARADCIDEAAGAEGVNRHVLRAIGWHESRLRSAAEHRNRNGTVDLGAFQINSIHLPRLQAQGLGATDLKHGCTAARVAAAHYRRLVERHGNTWRAVGAYHSEATPARQHWYAQQIAQVLVDWKLLPSGTRPFEGRPLLKPGQSAPPAQPLRASARAASATNSGPR